MTRTTPWLVALAAGVLSAVALHAQDLVGFFPLEVGRSWTYHLKLTSAGDTRTIEYTTRVARHEEVDGVLCAALENQSGDRLLQVNWYAVVDGGKRVVQPRRQNGRVVTALHADEPKGPPGRVLVDAAALARLPEATTWRWASADGHSQGTVRLALRERLRLRNYGELDCLVLVEEGTATSGQRRATFTRRLWLAAGLGLVQETSAITADGAETTSEAVLIRHEAP